MPDQVRLDTRVRTGADPDAVYDAFTGWVADQGLDLYPHQDEAVIELLGGQQRRPGDADRVGQVAGRHRPRTSPRWPATR